MNVIDGSLTEKTLLQALIAIDNIEAVKNPCDTNKNIRDDDLPVWRPYQYRSEHLYDEIGRGVYRCSECGDIIEI